MSEQQENMRQQSEELNSDSAQRQDALEKMRADKQARIEKAYQGWDAVPDELRTEPQLKREGLYLPSNAQPAAEVYSEHTFYSLYRRTDAVAVEATREDSGQGPQETKIPGTVRCPLCHAVFKPTEELLNSTSCPACGREFDYDDEWEVVK